MYTYLINDILEELIKGKYYSMIVDSTLDMSHMNQLVFAIRYVCSNGEPVEQFLTFMSNIGHKSNELKNTIV